MDKSKRVTVTQKQQHQLLAEKKRTGVGVLKLLRGTRKERPEGITVSMIEGWMSGEVSTAFPEHLNWVFKRYQNYQPKPKIKQKSDRIPISEDMRQHLISEKTRTGLGVVNIMRHLPSPLPEGLTKNIIQSWELGAAKSAKEKHWDAVVNTYAKLPNLLR